MQQHNDIQQRRSKPVHFKAYGSEISVTSRKISGYGAIFGNVDDAGDLIIKGAFAKSITERGPQSGTNRKVIFLWMHDMDEPLGRITVLREDQKGLYFEAEIDNIPQGDRVLEQLKSGTLNQFSIGYQYVWDKIEYNEEQDCFICKELNLFEISVVSIGCNEETGFEGMKAVQLEDERIKVTKKLEKALKALDLPLQYKLRKLIAKNIALAETKPPQALEQEKPQPDDNPITSDFIKSLQFH